MNITPINVRQNQNQKSFGIKLQAANEEAARLFSRIIPTDAFKKIEPEIDCITDSLGRDFVVMVDSNFEHGPILELSAGVEKQKFSQNVSQNSIYSKSSSIPRHFVDTLKAMTENINAKIKEDEYVQKLLAPKTADTQG